MSNPEVHSNPVPAPPPLDDVLDDLRKSSASGAATKTLQTSANPAGAARQVPLAELKESPWNPRKHFPAGEMDKLVASMKAEGFWPWNALVGRPHPKGGIEIAAGHRRSRAAKLAGLTSVPVYVRDMDDAEFLRVLTFDNSNREDPHPLDEAAGFRFYMERTKCKVTDIAAQIGQSKEYVYQRLKYADLSPAAQKAFWEERITAGHAVLIARLPDDKWQAKALDLFKHRDCSVRDLESWIERDVYRDVTKAFFDSASPDLVAGVPACTVCPKRAGNAPELFPEARPNTCTDSGCYERKQRTYVKIEIAKRYGEVKEGSDPAKKELLTIADTYYYNQGRQAGVLPAHDYTKVEGKRCDSARDAIVVEGSIGKKLLVCVDKKCPVHGRSASGNSVSAAQRTADKKRQEESRIARLVDGRLAAAAGLKASVPFGKKELLFLLSETVNYDNDEMMERFGITVPKVSTTNATFAKDRAVVVKHMAAMPVDQLARLVIELAFNDVYGKSREEAVASFGIDVSAVKKTVIAEQLKKAQAAPPPAKKPVAKKPAQPAAKPGAKKSPAKANKGKGRG